MSGKLFSEKINLYMTKTKFIYFLGVGSLLISCSTVSLFLVRNKIQGRATVKNFEECAKMGYPILQTYPRICRTPDGKSFLERAEGKNGQIIVPTSTTTTQSGLSSIPNYPLASIPWQTVSIKYAFDHRSALNEKTVFVKGFVVYTLLCEEACPSRRGPGPALGAPCLQSRIFLADTPAEDRDNIYDLTVLL